MKITLPYPPSANHYWHLASIKNSVRKFIGKKGKEFRSKVIETVGEVVPLESRLEVNIVVSPPDRRKRDLDNTLKPTLDALEAAKVFKDDSQIDLLKVSRGEIIKGGALHITIKELDEEK